MSMKFPYVTDLRIPGFERTVPPGSVCQLSFSGLRADRWFSEFCGRINESVSAKYLPIYRMADGEFIFCVGRKAELLPKNAPVPARLKHVLKKTLGDGRRSCPTCWGESYAGIPREELLSIYTAALGKIAGNGLLALHFVRSPGRFSEQYIEPMLDWFWANDVDITPENYTSFYFVYALLCGPHVRGLVSGRKILVVTSASPEKRKAIAGSLRSLGSAKTMFIQISPNRSLLDTIDLSRLEDTPDLALVAAGIGSVNILSRLEPLSIPCIDAGICIDILADPKMRGRVFTVPDEGAFHG